MDLLSQVMLRLRICVERAFIAAMQETEDAIALDGISLHYCDDDDMEPSLRDHNLLEYQVASKRASRGFQIVHMATDTGVSGNLPMQFKFMTITGNTGIVACPQASVVFDTGEGGVAQSHELFHVRGRRQDVW